MKLISWNVNGLRAITKKGFSQWLEQEKPDIVALQETKIDAAISSHNLSANDAIISDLLPPGG